MSDIAEVILALMEEEARRRKEGRSDWRIPMRPDHAICLPTISARRRSIPATRRSAG